MKQYRLYEECPHYDFRDCDFGCSRKPQKPCYPNFERNCDCFFPKPCKPHKPRNKDNCNHEQCCNNCDCELMYLFMGILIGRKLD